MRMETGLGPARPCLDQSNPRHARIALFVQRTLEHANALQKKDDCRGALNAVNRSMFLLLRKPESEPRSTVPYSLLMPLAAKTDELIPLTLERAEFRVRRRMLVEQFRIEQSMEGKLSKGMVRLLKFFNAMQKRR
ncbi:MAG: hypothetical protein M1530_03695 [Candidatus Marsarchaeota archaeon]|nr:hypothetical protein [Candidatus Marsarchaeota archaeon]